MEIVTCRTEGCPSEGNPVLINTTVTDDDTGETRRVDAVVCGACGHEITDVTDAGTTTE